MNKLLKKDFNNNMRSLIYSTYELKVNQKIKVIILLNKNYLIHKSTSKNYKLNLEV